MPNSPSKDITLADIHEELTKLRTTINDDRKANSSEHADFQKQINSLETWLQTISGDISRIRADVTALRKHAPN